MDKKLTLILEAASSLFRKLGIRSISMDEIAAELGMSKKTIYQYVENKTELVEKVLEYYTHSSNACIDAIAGNMNAIDVLMQVSEKVSEEISSANPIMLFDLQKYYPSLHRSFVAQKKEHVYQRIKENMEQGMKEGIYREGLDVELIAKLYVEKLLGVHNPEFLSSMEFTQEKIFKVMFENHIRGIANAKGLAYFENKINNPITQ
jgi:AcrR family transcriptional regulator